MSKKGHKGRRNDQKRIHVNKYAKFSHAEDAQARIAREMEKVEKEIQERAERARSWGGSSYSSSYGSGLSSPFGREKLRFTRFYMPNFQEDYIF